MFLKNPENNENNENLPVYKDGLIPYKYWFMHPQEWKTSINKEYMIALRRMTIRKFYRKIGFTYTISILEKSSCK